MDGTLTASKRPLTKAQASAFSRFARGRNVAVISGAGFPQMRKQFVSRLPKGKAMPDFFALALNGGELWMRKEERRKKKDTKGAKRWQRAYAVSFPIKLKKTALATAKKINIKFPEYSVKKTYGVVVEDRGGQITYSALGKNAPLPKKHAWDPRGAKRLKMAQYLRKLLLKCDVGVAGMTSIDITPKGLTKEFGVKRAMKAAGTRPAETVFVGDAVFRGGNDAPARRAGGKMVGVKNPRETYAWMRHFVANS